MKNRKILTVIVSFSLMITALLSFSSCATKPPSLEEVKEEFISLIEASAEINTIFFGEGLPVYDREGSEEEKSFYLSLGSELDNYEIVSGESKYITVNEIKNAAELVYTPEYLESVYEMVFDGYADENVGVKASRYYESGEWLCMSMNYEPLISGVREYDYGTMEMVKPSDGQYVNVSIESSLYGESLRVTLAFSKTENGWRLDTPTY